MKFLCLAYGSEKDWQALSKSEQDKLLAQDDAIRAHGDFIAAVQTKVTTVTAWNGPPNVVDGSFAKPSLPLAGFSIIEADSLDEVIELVSGTPCARAGGAIEIRPFFDFGKN